MYWGEVLGGHMGRGVMEEEVWRKGPWTAEEDRLLVEYVRLHGEGRWNSVSRLAGNTQPYSFAALFIEFYISKSQSHYRSKTTEIVFNFYYLHSGYIHSCVP